MGDAFQHSEVIFPIAECRSFFRTDAAFPHHFCQGSPFVEPFRDNLQPAGRHHQSFASRRELADKLAILYGIPVEDILDDYTLFLHRGGGAFLRRYREAKGWSRQQLADHAKVSRTSIRCWENGQKTISRKCFDLLVENLGSDFPSMLRM